MNHAEWLAIRLALNSLRNDLIDEIELIEKINAMSTDDPLPEVGESLIKQYGSAKDASQYIICSTAQVLHTAETLCEVGEKTAAWVILGLYKYDPGNASMILEYVDMLLSDLSQGRPY